MTICMQLKFHPTGKYSVKYGVKRVRIRSYSGPHFSRIFPHSDWIRRDTPYFLRSEVSRIELIIFHLLLLIVHCPIKESENQTTTRNDVNTLKNILPSFKTKIQSATYKSKKKKKWPDTDFFFIVSQKRKQTSNIDKKAYWKLIRR